MNAAEKLRGKAPRKKNKDILSWDDRWTLYHLMNGGMSARRELEMATGLDLGEVELEQVFLGCDIAVEHVRDLAKPVWCGYCNELTAIVPCQACRRHNRGDNFRAPPLRKTKNSIL